LALLLGVAGGIGGAALGRILIGLAGVARRFQGAWRQLGFALALGSLAALLVYLDPRAAGSGRETLADLLFNTQAHGDWKLAVSRFVAPVLAYSAGGAGGVFSPSLAAGGALGSLLAEVIGTPNSVLCVLCGMIAFLTGVTRAPFTAFVLVLEMTDRHSAIFPMMLSALLAAWAARWVDSRSFYDHVKARYLEAT
jgi:H+/Cl- antiporter ClcA